MYKGSYKIFQPCRGGISFIILQILSWSFYGISLIIIASSFYYAGTVDGLLASGGVIGVLAQAFMISSLLSYDEPEVIRSHRKSSNLDLSTKIKRRRKSTTDSNLSASKMPQRGALSSRFSIRARQATKDLVLLEKQMNEDENNLNISQEFANDALNRYSELNYVDINYDDEDYIDEDEELLDVKDANKKKRESIFVQFVQMNIALVAVGVFLALVSENVKSKEKRHFAGILSLICCIVAVMLTHGIGGILKHGDKGWRFSQSFVGGSKFVLFQIIGWSFFGLAILIMGISMYTSIVVGREFIKGSFYFGGLSIIIAEFVLLASFPLYKVATSKSAKSSKVGDKTNLVYKDEKATKNEILKQKNEYKKNNKKENRMYGSGKNINDGEYELKYDPINYRELQKFPFLSGLFVNTIVFLFANTQYISFFSYLFIFMIPFMLPPTILPYLSFITLGCICDLNVYMDYTAYEAFIMWLWFFFDLSIWVFVYSSLKVFNISGWRNSLILSLVVVTVFPTLLTSYNGRGGFNCLLFLTSCNIYYMATTYTKLPENNGCREWKAFRDSEWLLEVFQYYYGLQIHLTDELKAVRKQIGKENASDPRLSQVIIGFAPHGIFPTTHIYLSSSPLFRKEFPNLHVHPMVASIIHIVPVMRDIAQWSGKKKNNLYLYILIFF